MENQKFNKGIVLTALGSFWWRVIGVIYLKYILLFYSTYIVIIRFIF
jgi:chloramphenicol-sensitive protein RarD